MPALHKVKLDRDRVIKYPFSTFVVLDECGINVFDPRTYRDFRPKQGAALVWAGQLHTKDPLSLQAVNELLPTETDKWFEVMTVCVSALNDALGVKDETGEKPVASA